MSIFFSLGIKIEPKVKIKIKIMEKNIKIVLLKLISGGKIKIELDMFSMLFQ